MRARNLAEANLRKLEGHVLSAVRSLLARERVELPDPDLEAAYNQGWHGVCQMVVRGEEIENLNGPRTTDDPVAQVVRGASSASSQRARACALARHYRDVEGLSIADIAARLGRSPASVRAYLYDPRRRQGQTPQGQLPRALSTLRKAHKRPRQTDAMRGVQRQLECELGPPADRTGASRMERDVRKPRDQYRPLYELRQEESTARQRRTTPTPTSRMERRTLAIYQHRPTPLPHGSRRQHDRTRSGRLGGSVRSTV